MRFVEVAAMIDCYQLLVGLRFQHVALDLVMLSLWRYLVLYILRKCDCVNAFHRIYDVLLKA